MRVGTVLIISYITSCLQHLAKWEIQTCFQQKSVKFGKKTPQSSNANEIKSLNISV